MEAIDGCKNAETLAANVLDTGEQIMGSMCGLCFVFQLHKHVYMCEVA